MPLAHRWLGEVPLDAAIALMEEYREAVLDGSAGSQVLLLCEHPPVITLGRSASPADVVMPLEVLAARGVAVTPTSRGGQVTYHGPGQLMIYPVVRLGRGLLALLSAVADQLSLICSQLGVAGAEFRRNPAGVWVGDRKVAACGIHIRRRVMTHGFALNLSTPAEAWQLIVPCGLPERSIASVRELGGLGSLDGVGGHGTDAANIATRFGADLARAVAHGAGFELR